MKYNNNFCNNNDMVVLKTYKQGIIIVAVKNTALCSSFRMERAEEALSILFVRKILNDYIIL